MSSVVHTNVLSRNCSDLPTFAKAQFVGCGGDAGTMPQEFCTDPNHMFIGNERGKLQNINQTWVRT